MMYLLVTMVICFMVITKHGNTEESNYEHLQCLFNVHKLKNILDVMGGECLASETVESIQRDFKDISQECVRMCGDICQRGGSAQRGDDFTETNSCIYMYLNFTITKDTVYGRLYLRKGCSEKMRCVSQQDGLKCKIMSNYLLPVKTLFLGKQESSTPCPTSIANLCTSTTTLIPTTATCKPCPLSTTEDKEGTTTLSSETEFLHDRCGEDDSDCPGIAVGVGCLGIVIGVIITSTICICWIQRKQPRRNFEGQAMTNRGYLITGVPKNSDVESKPRQRSVIYSEINDEPTHGNPKISHVAPIIRNTEGKTTNEAPNDKDVYNHLNEEINEDDADDYDHARPVLVQNNEADNAYEKLDNTAAIPKSIPDDKRISSSSVNHDYGELEIVETDGMKRLDNETKKMESDENVGNEDSDNYFTLEKSQI